MKIVGKHDINEGLGKWSVVEITKIDGEYDVHYTPTVEDGRLERGTTCKNLAEMIEYILECANP